MALETIAIAVTVASAAASAATSIVQGEAAEDAAKYNAAVAENDARAIAEQSQYEAQRVRERNRRILASQRAGQAKSGLAMSGSFQDVQLDSAIQGEMDALAAIYTGQINSGSAKARAELARLEGRNAKRSGYMSAGASLLSGGAQAYSIKASAPKKSPSFGSGTSIS